MTKPNRLGTALTAASLIAIVAGCAGPASSGPRSASIFGGKVDTANIGLATKAQLALAANDVAGAIPLAERAVENSPNDAGFRALLGNCYLAAGRFASAEAAYRDSLTLVSNQPQLILKLALVMTAQGKNGEAIALLSEGQSVLDPADLGLALTLAGDTQSALQVLDPAARATGADARTRQNLALANAFAGNWEQARLIAAQDIPGDQVDARIEQWMTLSKPSSASQQVASFIGVKPASSDSGQPIRLALNKDDAKARQAVAAPVATPVVQPEPIQVAAAEPQPAPEPVYVAPEPAPVLSSTATVDLPPAAPVAIAAADTPAPVRIKAKGRSVHQPHPGLSPAAARLTTPVASLRRDASMPVRAGTSRTVVQLGSFSSRDRVAGAWSKAAAKHAALRGYTPVSARFTSGRGTFYRLSVNGFSSNREASNLCAAVKRSGGTCFVRAAFNDAPVQIASR